MNETEVKKKVEEYFTDTFPQFSVSQECEVSFGSKRGGFADVVLHTDKPGYFVAIAECKRSPLPTQQQKEKAKEQLKSYMSATNTRYGVLAVGEDPGNWEFCENKYHNYFVSINRKKFERSVENWEPIEVNLQRERKAARWWKRIVLFLGVLFVVSISSLLLLWPDPPEPTVYITETGKKYHTHNCKFLRDNNVENKFAIYLDEARKNYDPCGICSPHSTEKSR